MSKKLGCCHKRIERPSVGAPCSENELWEGKKTLPVHFKGHSPPIFYNVGYSFPKKSAYLLHWMRLSREIKYCKCHLEMCSQKSDNSGVTFWKDTQSELTEAQNGSTVVGPVSLLDHPKREGEGDARGRCHIISTSLHCRIKKRKHEG